MNANREVVTWNAPSVPLTSKKLKCAIVLGCRECDRGWRYGCISAARDGMTPPVRRHAFTSESGILQWCESRALTFIGLRLRNW